MDCIAVGNRWILGCDSGADLGCRRGITEFLPVSSTGHQIIVADLIGFGGERALAFNIIIQLGAILAVIWEYRRKIIDVVVGLPKERQAQKFTVNLLIAFMPAVVLGVAFADLIHEYLFNPITVAAALVIGGIVMLWAERRDHAIRAETVDDMTDAGLEGRFRSVSGAGAGHLAVGLDHHRRAAVRPVAQGRHRVLVLSGNAHHGRCCGLLRLQVPRSVPAG